MSWSSNHYYRLFRAAINPRTSHKSFGHKEVVSKWERGWNLPQDPQGERNCLFFSYPPVNELFFGGRMGQKERLQFSEDDGQKQGVAFRRGISEGLKKKRISGREKEERVK